MPVSTPPRKKYNPRKRMASTKGAWDSVRDMIANARLAMRNVGDLSRLLLERKKIDPNFDEPKAKAMLSVLYKDMKEFKSSIDAIDAELGDNRGDIREDDIDSLLVTMRMSTSVQEWLEKWDAVVSPQVEELHKLIVSE